MTRFRVRLLLAVLAVLAPLTAVIGAGEPAAANVLADQIDDPTPRPLGPITFLGDSVALGSLLYSPTIADQLAAHGWGPIRARAGVGYNARPSGGPTEARVIYWIETWRSQGWDPADVVINLGANDSANCTTVDGCRAIIQRVLDAIGPDHRVWWPMITHLTPGQAERWNAALAQLADERDDFFTWDWPTVMATGGYASPDGIHLTAPAYRQRSAAMAADITADLARGRRVGGPAPLPVAAGPRSELVPLTSRRALDTRDGPPIGAEQTVEVDVSALVPAGTTAIAVYVSATQPEGPGYITAFPCDQPRPLASSANYAPGETRGAVALVPIPGGRVCLFTKATAHLLADVQGAFVPAGDDVEGGTRLRPLDMPVRLLDTRVAGRSEILTVPVQGDPVAVAVNLTAVGSDAAGHLTAFPCGAKIPTAAAVNHGPHEAVAGSAFVPVGEGGAICIFSKAADADVVVDLTATLGDGGDGLVFTPSTPTRTIDTRNATGGWSPVHGQFQTIDARVAPPGAQAVSGTLTIAAPARPGFLRAWGCGTQPETSNVNAPAGAVLANQVTTAVDGSGTLCVMARSLTTTIFDTTGWWTAP